MSKNADELYKAFHTGRIGRRELMRALGATAGAALAASAFPEVSSFAGPQMATPAGNMALRAVAYNHINYQVTDYAKVRDFYITANGKQRVLISTDRMFVFDTMVGLVPYKGQVLNQLAQQCAGPRMLPARSDPSPRNPSPAASAAAVPPDEPPGVRPRSQGLFVTP